MVRVGLPYTAAIPSTRVVTIQIRPKPPFRRSQGRQQGATRALNAALCRNLYVTTKTGYFINVLNSSLETPSPHSLSWPSMGSPLDLDDLVA